MKYSLYGDGIHDDYPAIQELIDSGICELHLPTPKNHYIISKTLILPSNFKLVLPRFAEIRLANGSNCHMLRSETKTDRKERLSPHCIDLCRHLWYHVNEYSPDFTAENIEICGGIWNFNNREQLKNPEQSKIFEPYGYTGDGMLFYGVRNLKLSSMTFKDPVHYGACFDRVSYFTIEDITFDYNLGNPVALNMDGVHFNGNCHYGVIRNLKGACYDDLVALNAHEGSKGPITNIQIDGLFAEVCHSAVRLLTVSDNIENIRISNVYGTYYQYCIGLTKYYPGETTGSFSGITLDGIFSSKAFRDGIYPSPESYVFPFIFIQENVKCKDVTIKGLHRNEYTVPVPTVFVGKNAVVDSLTLDGAYTENHTDGTIPLLENNGIIEYLDIRNTHTGNDPVKTGNGTVKYEK